MGQHLNTKHGSFFHYGVKWVLLQNAGVFYYKTSHFYYKPPQVLQNVPIITKCGTAALKMIF